MRPLTASDILKVWEQGEAQPAIERALTMLAVACPELDYAELAALDIGGRDARLFELRELTFGPRMDGFTACGHCQERLEFMFDLEAFKHRSSALSNREEFEFETDGWALHFRLPDSHDLAAVGTCEDVANARRLLAERCVLQASRNGDVIAALSDDAVTQLARRIGECAPEAEVLLDFACPSCGHEWQSLFDIAAFFWTEIAAQAKRLLREVHLLASAYGWREAEILAMSARRRQAYLEMMG
ncbi:MAG: phage baseplate protein [Acidobacteriota bacterium]